MHFLAAGQVSTIGEKGFPINFGRTTSYPEPTGPRVHPIPMALQDIATLWFRVAQWTVSTNIGASNGVNSCSVSGGILSAIGDIPTREYNYLLNSNYDIGPDLWNFRLSSPPSLVNLVMFSLSFPDPIADVLGTFFPSIVVSGGSSSGGGPTDVSVGFDSFSVGTAGSAGACTILGYTIPIIVAAAGPGASVTGTAIDFTPSLWWPYAARDGSPIYDTATGVALQNPAN